MPIYATFVPLVTVQDKSVFFIVQNCCLSVVLYKHRAGKINLLRFIMAEAFAYLLLV